MKIQALLLLTLSAGFVLSGCGGSQGGASQSSRTGKVRITIKWPSRTRLIPAQANSISVQLLDPITKAVLIAKPLTGSTEFVNRPSSGQTTTTVTTVDIPIGSYTVEADAYPDSIPSGNGTPTGAALATGSTGLNITGGSVPIQFSIGMASDATQAGVKVIADGDATTTQTVTPTATAPASVKVSVHSMLHITAVPQDSGGKGLFLFPTSSSGGDSAVTVSSSVIDYGFTDTSALATGTSIDGYVSCNAVGTGKVTIQYPEGNESFTVNVVATDPLVTTAPTFTTVAPSGLKSVDDVKVAQAASVGSNFIWLCTDTTKQGFVTAKPGTAGTNVGAANDKLLWLGLSASNAGWAANTTLLDAFGGATKNGATSTPYVDLTSGFATIGTRVGGSATPAPFLLKSGSVTELLASSDVTVTGFPSGAAHVAISPQVPVGPQVYGYLDGSGNLKRVSYPGNALDSSSFASTLTFSAVASDGSVIYALDAVNNATHDPSISAYALDGTKIDTYSVPKTKTSLIDWSRFTVVVIQGRPYFALAGKNTAGPVFATSS